MSAFSDAARQLIESELECPRCQAVNIPGKPADVRIEDGDTNYAGCVPCGFYGHVRLFQRKTEPPR